MHIVSIDYSIMYYPYFNERFFFAVVASSHPFPLSLFGQGRSIILWRRKVQWRASSVFQLDIIIMYALQNTTWRPHIWLFLVAALIKHKRNRIHVVVISQSVSQSVTSTCKPHLLSNLYLSYSSWGIIVCLVMSRDKR
jgi:hypothetical protein